MPEMLPRFREAFRQLLVRRRVQDLTGIGVGEAFAQVFQFARSGVVRQPFDHRMAAGGDDGGVERMVAVAIFADFQQAPTRAQEGGQLPVDHHTTARIAVAGQLQVLFDIVLEKLADVAGVVQVAVFERLGFVGAVVLAQQAAALGLPVGFVALHPGDEVAPPITEFATCKAGQVFVGGAVALVLVLAGEDQHLVVLAVVVAAGVGQGVVHLHIGRVFDNPVQVQRLQRIGAFAMLFPVQQPFFELGAGRAAAETVR